MSEWVKDNGSYYYYDSDGTMATGWQELDGYWYYFYSDGSMAWDTMVEGYYVNDDGQWTKDEGSRKITDNDGNDFWYYVGPEGKVVTGWNKIGDNFHYYNYPGGSMTYENTIDGFQIDEYGNIVSGTGWIQDEYSGNWYYFSEGSMATGWIQDGDNWYYLNADGSMATGWKNINGDWYYFHSDGTMATGWVNDGTGCYYLYGDGNGSMAWGKTVDGYLLDNGGKMVTGTGWKSLNGDWYYLNNDKEATGWLKDGDNWYYLYGDNGSMAWGTTIDGYYLNNDGEWVPDTKTGWMKIGDDWYYFNDNGKKLTNTWIQSSDGNNWYYVDSDGKMKTTDYIEYGNGRKIYFHQDGTAFEFDYDGGDAQENDDVTNAIMLASGARDVIAIGAKIGKAVIGGVVKTAIKIAGKDAAKDASEAAIKDAGEDTAKGVSNPNNFKIINETSAEETNNWWKDVMNYDNPPYKPGTTVNEIELTEKTTFVRVYDGDTSGMYGGWVMKAEDIEGLTPAQIQDKFALPSTPKYVADVNLEAGTHLRTGVVNPLDGWGNGGGIQFDLMGQRTGEFVNPRPLP
ncbi:cell wall binding repeat-containing protein [Clostridium sp. DL-VIII]|uniref:cell wall binding repeat-containing protein n=1 Tax=Clostridium sp. DL-VIII TaxID=641107 RepID=UPI00023AF6A3|nr:cell wall binding repeat-containing protein [Clostridium sp. DL-VIII]EHI97937.1 cell wall binding repeat-containing protein [Clostridium sp. DL-VIII]